MLREVNRGRQGQQGIMHMLVCTTLNHRLSIWFLVHSFSAYMSVTSNLGTQKPVCCIHGARPPRQNVSNNRVRKDNITACNKYVVYTTSQRSVLFRDWAQIRTVSSPQHAVGLLGACSISRGLLKSVNRCNYFPNFFRGTITCTVKLFHVHPF